jgi:selenide,water dikinase
MIRLTATAKSAGCAAKLSPSVLDAVLKKLPRRNDANVLVGYETSDDAAVYRIAPGIAMVQTVDFFTPIVDDPFTFGQIAAANALSDVYAMGGLPLTALSIVAFPPSNPPDILEAVLRGGLDKTAEANCTVVGGHSIRDEELKFGYAVTGIVDPEKIWRNVGARPGDVLILTKPIGTGVISTALKNGKAKEEWVHGATESMLRLNASAGEALREVEASWQGETPFHAVTDVTGFSLLGHAREMAIGSGVSMVLNHAVVAYLPGAVQAAGDKNFSGGMANNRQFLDGCVNFAPGVAEEFQALCFDPQTSGGLLIAVASDAIDPAMLALEKRKIPARVIGEALEKNSPLIRVI